jgi:hypothetical protein
MSLRVNKVIGSAMRSALVSQAEDEEFESQHGQDFVYLFFHFLP